LKRCTSSRNRIVPRPSAPSARRAVVELVSHVLHAGLDSRECPEPARRVLCKQTRHVVLPVPGGPKNTAELSRSSSTKARSGAPGPRRWRWPTTSSNRVGRKRAASGARTLSSSATATSNRSGGRRLPARPDGLGVTLPACPTCPPPQSRPSQQTPSPETRPRRPSRPRRDNPDTKLRQNPRREGFGRARHQVGSGLRLRVRDHLTDVVLASQQRHEPVQADCESTVGWRTVAERSEKEAESGLRILI